MLAGFMRLLSPVFIRAYSNRIMNIHPALLPAFPGLHVQKKAVEHGVRFSGCTVHFVNEECDEGPIIIQAVVPVFPDDTEESLAARILKQEHRIYPRAIQLYSEGKLRIVGRKVLVDGLANEENQVLIQPQKMSKTKPVLIFLIKLLVSAGLIGFFLHANSCRAVFGNAAFSEVFLYCAGAGRLLCPGRKRGEMDGFSPPSGL